MASQRALGRGFLELFGEETTEPMGGDEGLHTLQIAEIHPNPGQPRHIFDEDELDELADSIRTNGLLQPIVVRKVDDGYQIIAGERRWQASQRAGLREIAAVVRVVDDATVLSLALIENLQRSDLTPLEAARGYRALMEQNGLTQEDVARMLSKSRPTISNALRLLELPQEVQDMVESGLLSAGHARAILRTEGDEARIALAEKVVSDHLSVRQTEFLAPLFSVKEEEGKDAERAPNSPPASYSSAAERLGERLGAKVVVRTVRGHSRIEIEFGDEHELSSIVGRIMNDHMTEG